MALFLGTTRDGCPGFRALRFASVPLLLLGLLLVRPHAVRSYEDDLSLCIDTLDTVLADEMWLEHLADPVILDNAATGEQLKLYNHLSECVAPLKSAEGLGDEVSGLLTLVEYYDLFVGAWLAGEGVYAYDLAVINDPAIQTLREEIGLPPPPGLVFVRPFASDEELPDPLDDIFADEAVRGVTILTRYVAVLLPEDTPENTTEAERQFLLNDFKETISHELVHTYVNASLGLAGKADMPEWFREGIAIYFSGSSEAHSIVTFDGIRAESRPTTEYYNYQIDFKFLEARLGKDALHGLVRSSLESRSVDGLYRAAGVAGYEELRVEADEWRSKSQFRRYSLLLGVFVVVLAVGWWYFFRSPLKPAPVAQSVAVSAPTPSTASAVEGKPVAAAMRAMPGDLVTLHYELRSGSEEVIRSSYGRAPLRFVAGSQESPFASLVDGMKVGEYRVLPLSTYAPTGGIGSGKLILTLEMVALARPPSDQKPEQPGGLAFA